MERGERGHNLIGMATATLNPNPVVYSSLENLDLLRQQLRSGELNEEGDDPIDDLEVFDLIRKINDPEHPLTLEQLKVTDLKNVHVDDANNMIQIFFTPTIPHCSMATLIGLCIRVKLIRSLPSRFKVDIKVAPGSHASEDAVNKQLNDKERIAAALENQQLLNVLNNCIAHTD
uniref:MIP18 family-like domain-containing protein n=1 Tax=Vannella robusta TaxID=1487602 RepID=A0A7S4M439_9EUKA|mmetsp:Transcript_1074/g.1317  ORF Transcript_1074/g.1317 Transcript_1074/m.1317 type:complete len:174 (+) Transcript_1074:177-698(+)